MSQPYSHVASAVQSLAMTGAMRATKYISPKHTVKVTRQRALDRRERAATFLVTIGTPNYRERQFIKDAVKAGEAFPIRKVQLQFPRAAA